MNEQSIFIVRCGEVALKGMNKPYFERMLVERIKKNVKQFAGVDVRRHEGLIYVRADKSIDREQLPQTDRQGLWRSVHQSGGRSSEQSGRHRRRSGQIYAGSD